MTKRFEPQLLSWYRESARPLLEAEAPADVPRIDRQVERVQLQYDDTSSEEVAICFLGSAGVGKSTLLNSLVSTRHNLLPHGGVGPLTAQATVVRFAERPYFRANYFSRNTLRGIWLALEGAHLRSLAARRASAETESPPMSEDSESREAMAALHSVAGDETGFSEKLDVLQRQVRLMVSGEQQGEVNLPYLLDGMRAALGLKNRWGHAPTEIDAARIARLKECIDSTGRDAPHRERITDGGDLADFQTELDHHASGHLAPLIESLTVGWNDRALEEGLVLVDLPGVGVANDQHALVTASWIRDKARAIVLVVDHRGVTEASADLLRTSGFLNRLQYSGDDADSDPVSLAVAVVKVDEVATTAWRKDDERSPDGARDWSDYFREACEQTIQVVKGQVHTELAKLAAHGAEDTRTAREEAVSRVLATLQIHPVSAPEYRLFHGQRRHDPPHVASAEESRVPQLIAALQVLARAQRERRANRDAQSVLELSDQVRSSLELVRARWEEDTRAAREAEQLQQDLELFLAPLRRELEARRAAFREYLRHGVRAQIEGGIAKATLTARDDIAEFLEELDDLHWATLRATVRKLGRHETSAGRRIDLPNELALRFEEPVAVVWSRQILTSLRRRSKELGDDYVAQVGEVVEWARHQEARVQPRFVEALHKNLVAQTSDLALVGKEAVDDLKAKVRSQLYDKLLKKVRRSCEKFIEQKRDVGPGVKKRIIEHFRDELARAVIDAAGPVAQSVLLENYGEVQKEIGERFESYRNPLDAARDAIVQSHEDGVRRSDAQRRRRMLERIDGVIEAMPRMAR